MTRAMNVAAESTEPSLILSRPSTRSAAAMLLFASLAFASPIAAQDGTGEKDLLAELQACRSIAVPAERLACFDRYRIKIEEGSVWQIDSAPSRLRMPRPGDEIVLKKASLGSFFIRIAGQIGVKGKRVE